MSRSPIPLLLLVASLAASSPWGISLSSSLPPPSSSSLNRPLGLFSKILFTKSFVRLTALSLVVESLFSLSPSFMFMFMFMFRFMFMSSPLLPLLLK